MESLDERNFKIERLKKSNFRLKIIIVVMFFVCLMLSLYSFVQQGIASENARLAIEQKNIAEQNLLEANRQRDQVIKVTDEIRRQTLLLEEQNRKLKK